MISQELLNQVPELQPEEKGGIHTRFGEGLRSQAQHVRRLMSHSGSVAKEFFKEHAFTTILPPAAVVVGLGAAEGGLYSNWDLSYMLSYGVSSLTAAPIWVRDSAEALAAVVGHDASDLRNFSAEATAGKITAEEAGTNQFVADKLYQVRSIIGGTTIFINAATLAFTLLSAKKELQQDIFAGKEPLWKDGEQVFFVGGRQSNILEARMARNPKHTVPILEEVEGAGQFIEKASDKGKKPAYVLVDKKNYGNSNTWEKIKFNKQWLVDVDGQKKLIVVGDGSVYDEALDLRAEAKIDVTIKELQVSSDKLRERASAAGVNLTHEDVITIYLGDGGRDIITGGGNTVDLRDHIKKYGSVDILIDTRAPLIERLVAWLDGRQDVVFDTTNREYFETVKAMLGQHAISVHDQMDPHPANTPHFVYEEVTAETVKRAEEIVYAKEIGRDSVLAITDTVDGHDYAKREGIQDICTALVYDQEVENVISLLKKGNSPSEVQAWLDYRWTFSEDNFAKAPPALKI